MARRRSERRYSIWTFVAPVVLVVAVLVVVNVTRPLTERGDDAPASTSTTSTGTSTGTRTTGGGQGAATTGTGTGAARQTVYTVKADDTLSGIAEQFGTTAARIQTLNPGLQANALQIGQRIRVA